MDCIHRKWPDINIVRYCARKTLYNTSPYYIKPFPGPLIKEKIIMGFSFLKENKLPYLTKLKMNNRIGVDVFRKAESVVRPASHGSS